MSQPSNILSFEEALKALNSLSETNLAKDHWIPSIKEVIRLKEINAEQQKKLLSTALQNSVITEKIYFEQFVYEVLKENNLTPAVEINNLSVLDRIFLCLSLKNQISSQVKVKFIDPDTEEEYTEDVNLKALVEGFKNFNHPDIEEIVFERDNLKVKILLQIPKLGLDHFYFQNAPFLKIQNKELSDQNLLNNIITEGFIFETSKYIKNIFLDGQDLSYSSWDLRQKTFFIEKLPIFIVQSIFDKMTLWKNSVEPYLTVTSSKGHTAIVDINSAVFLG
jgi:hypothetical protein